MLVDWSEADRESWLTVFGAEVSRRGFNLSDGALFVLEKKLQEKSPWARTTTDIEAAMRALAQDSIVSAMQYRRTTIAREDIEYAFRKCTHYPFC